jgi:3-oxoacyl-(acyl-carrier-protein) synthase
MAAASDLAEVIWGMKALTQRFAPATLNFQETETEFARLNVSGHHLPTDQSLFVSSSYGLGGQSSAIVIGV